MQKGRVSRKMENAGRWLRRATLIVFLSFSIFSLFLCVPHPPPSLSLSRFFCVILLFTCTGICIGASFSFVACSERELGVTIQSTCFTFKSSCRVAISNRTYGTACVHIHYDYSEHPRLSTGRFPARCAGQCFFRAEIPVSPRDRFGMKSARRDSEVPRKRVLYSRSETFISCKLDVFRSAEIWRSPDW